MDRKLRQLEVSVTPPHIGNGPCPHSDIHLSELSFLLSLSGPPSIERGLR